MNTTNPTGPATAPASTLPILSIADRDDMIDNVLDKLAQLPVADRIPMIEGVLAALADPAPRSLSSLLNKARVSFWEAALDLARLDAGEAVKGGAIPTGRGLTRTDLRRHVERKAWSAATVIPLRTFDDLLPRSLHGIADGLAHVVHAQDAPPSPPARVQH